MIGLIEDIIAWLPEWFTITCTWLYILTSFWSFHVLNEERLDDESDLDDGGFLFMFTFILLFNWIIFPILAINAWLDRGATR
jgi:hypothetical protein